MTSSMRGVLMLVFSGVFVAGVIITLVVFTGPDLGPDGCAIGEVPPASIYVVSDQSDTFLEREAQDLKRVVQRLAGDTTAMPIGAKLSVLTWANNTFGDIETVFSRCRPKTGLEADPWRETEWMVQAEYESSFEEPLLEALDGLVTSVEGDESPILEAIRRLSLRPDFRAARNRRLILVSNLTHNVKGKFSMYRDDFPSWEEFTESQYGADVTADLDLTDVVVQIIYLA